MIVKRIRSTESPSDCAEGLGDRAADGLDLVCRPHPAAAPRPWGRVYSGDLCDGRISNFYKSTVGAEHRAARKSDAQGTAPLHRPRTDIRPLSASSTTIQPLYNRFSTPRQLSETSTHPQPSFNRHTNHLSIAFQPPPTRSSPKPPPIRRDKHGHPLPSHTAPRRLATMSKHEKGGRAEARPPHYAKH